MLEQASYTKVLLFVSNILQKTEPFNPSHGKRRYGAGIIYSIIISQLTCNSSSVNRMNIKFLLQYTQIWKELLIVFLSFYLKGIGLKLTTKIDKNRNQENSV